MPHVQRSAAGAPRAWQDRRDVRLQRAPACVVAGEAARGRQVPARRARRRRTARARGRLRRRHGRGRARSTRWSHAVLVVTDDHVLAARARRPRRRGDPRRRSDDLNASLVQAAAELRTVAGRRLRIAAVCADLPALRPDDLDRALAASPRDRLAFVADADGVGTTMLGRRARARSAPLRPGVPRGALPGGAARSTVDGLDRCAATWTPRRPGRALRLGVGRRTAVAGRPALGSGHAGARCSRYDDGDAHGAVRARRRHRAAASRPRHSPAPACGCCVLASASASRRPGSGDRVTQPADPHAPLAPPTTDLSGGRPAMTGQPPDNRWNASRAGSGGPTPLGR